MKFWLCKVLPGFNETEGGSCGAAFMLLPAPELFTTVWAGCPSVFFIDFRNVFKVDELGLEIVHIELPTLLTFVADPAASLFDTAFVGHVGPVELAAVGIAIAVFNQVSKIANFPLVSITTSFVAEEDTTEPFSTNEQVYGKLENATFVSTEMEVLIPLVESTLSSITNDPTEIVKVEPVRRHIPAASSALVIGSVLGVIQTLFLISAANPIMNYMGVDSVG